MSRPRTSVADDPDESFSANFWAKVLKPSGSDGCWEWTGARMRGTHPYGQIRRRGQTLYAHRVSYELSVGPIPDGQSVLHKCDNPPCVRPDHLFSGSAEDNTRDMVAKGRARGEAHAGSTNGFAKLTENQVQAIRARHAGGERQTALAAEFGITQANVSLIVRGEAWKHVTDGDQA